MDNPLARAFVRHGRNSRGIRGLGCGAAICAALLIVCAGCSRLKPVDTSPLETSGMSYVAVKQLETLRISGSEVSEVAKARQGGFADVDCVEIVRIYRNRNRPFDAGDAVAGLAQVGVSDADILELASIDQLGLGWGELQAMKLAGMSDAIVMEEARQRARGKSVLSGATLAKLKNAGVRQSTLLQLVQRAVPESQARAILAYRHRGASEVEILRHFRGS